LYIYYAINLKEKLKKGGVIEEGGEVQSVPFKSNAIAITHYGNKENHTQVHPVSPIYLVKLELRLLIFPSRCAR
jgi:hypothetical protein